MIVVFPAHVEIIFLKHSETYIVVFFKKYDWIWAQKFDIQKIRI